MDTLKPAKSPPYQGLDTQQLDNLITKVELSITEQKTYQAALDQDLREAEAMYLEVKGKYDAHQRVIDLEQATLDKLVRMKMRRTPEQENKVYKTISNTKQKRADRREAIRWIKESVTYLRKNRQFLTPHNLVDHIIAANTEFVKRVDKKDRHNAVSYLKVRVTNGIARGLRAYDGKIGLEEWFSGDGKGHSLKPEFVKQFMG